jgi:hypothetical protein
LALFYSLFGLVVRSNVAVPGAPRLVGDPASTPCDVELHLGVEPYGSAARAAQESELVYDSPYRDENGEATLRIWKVPPESFLRLDYSEGIQFWLDGPRRNVWARWPEHLTLEVAWSYLLGPVFGLLLRLRGVTCLHASAVALGDWGIIFVGPEGAGKSTTAAAFAKSGYAVLSDDIVALICRPRNSSAVNEEDGTGSRGSHNEFLIAPAYPHLCLWPDSVRMLYGEGEALPRISPDWDKRRLLLGTAGTRFETRALPVGAIYLFAERGPDPAPYIQPAFGQTSLISLLANTYANNLLDRRMRAEEFALLDQLVSTVPVRVLTPHEDSARLRELLACIRDDFELLLKPGNDRQTARENKT